MRRLSETERRVQQRIRQTTIGVGVLVIVATAVAAYGISAFWPLTTANLSAFGDFLAGTAGILLALAGVGLIFLAFQAQLLQIEQQREELRLTKDDMALARDQLAQQNDHLRRQRDEATFFQLVNLHHGIVEAIRIPHYNVIGQDGKIDLVLAPGHSEGRHAFARIRQLVSEHFKISVSNEFEPPTIDAALKSYGAIYLLHQSELGHYFRNLYHIVKFVDGSSLEDKRRYANFIRAQLSSNELMLLAYNGVSFYGRRKFKPLIEKYQLLQNAPLRMLLDPTHKDAYVTAFGVRPPDESASGLS